MAEKQTSNRARWIAAGLVALCGLVFLPGLAGEFVWDDNDLISGNSYVRDPALLGEALTHDFWHTSSTTDRSEARHSFYRPVVTLAYFVQFQLFGERPLFYHLVSLALHVACVLLAFSWLRRRLGEGGTAVLAAGAAAALLAVHPARVESVSWISGSTDLWLALFVLLGLQVWDRRPGKAGIVLASLCFILATLSKESGALAPLLLLVDAVLLAPDRAARRAQLRRTLVPVLAVLAATGLRLLLVPTRLTEYPQGIWDSVRRVASSLGLYLGRIFWPWPPSVQIGFQYVDASGRIAYQSWSVVVGFVAVAGLVALVLQACRRPSRRRTLADVAWLVLPLLPVLNVVALNLKTLVAARYLYLPLLGLGILVGRAALRVATAERPIRLAGLAGWSLVLVGWGAVAMYQQASLHSDEALWAYEHAVAPENPYAATNLAKLRLARGRHAEALALVGEAYVHSPRQPAAQAEQILLAAQIVLAATSDADQATLLGVRRFFDDAAAGRRARLAVSGLALELAPNAKVGGHYESDVDSFHVPQAVAHARTVDLAGAERLFLEALADYPGSVNAWANLALVLARQGRWDDAEDAVARGLGAKPDDAFLRSLRSRMAQARARDQAAANADTVTRELLRAETAVEFGGIELARRMLDPLVAARPDDPRPFLLRLRADVADKRFDLARDLIHVARSRDPGRAAVWDDLWNRLMLEEAKSLQVPGR